MKDSNASVQRLWEKDMTTGLWRAVDRVIAISGDINNQ